jgi:outer membrane immunogenic protein
VSDRQGVVADWSGFYIGGQLGGAWSDLDWQYQNANYFNTLGPVVVGNNFSQGPSGVIGGILGGYNYQTGPWVFGLELSASAADMREEQPSPFFPTLDASTSRIGWVVSAAGRLGYAWDRWLVFAKGGWAGADVELTLSDASAAVYGSDDQWANGWTVGAGGEYMFCDHISLGVAYDYADITVDDTTVTCPACNGVGAGFGTPVVDADVKVQSVMGRLIFHQ